MMGKIKCFDIVFAENKSVYHPGEMVTGQCVLELKGKLNYQSVYKYLVIIYGLNLKFYSK